jgi:hypothetical protein
MAITGRKTNEVERQLRLTEIYRQTILGIPDQDIRTHKKVDVSPAQYQRDIKAIRNRIVTEEVNKRREYFLQDMHVAVDRLLQDKRLNFRIIQAENTPVEVRQRAIEFDASLNTTILKIKYEGSLFLRGIDYRAGENLRHLQQQADSIRSAQLEHVNKREPSDAIFQ